MNYRHAFHAGNHADILKHIVLVRLLVRLGLKDKPFRVVDAHAGAGLYGLESDEAARTLEWQDGLGRLFSPGGAEITLAAEVESLISPWRSVVRAVNASGRLEFYPGSPQIIRHHLRPDDRLVLNDLHPEEAEKLRTHFGRDRRVKVTQVEAVQAVKASLPPPERRGLILIDPPYERTDEVEQIVLILAEGLRRFPTGIYCIWYPLTGDGLDSRLVSALSMMKLPAALKCEMQVRELRTGGGLAGSGLYIFNPPWQLDADLASLLPALAQQLSQTGSATSRIRMHPPAT